MEYQSHIASITLSASIRTHLSGWRLPAPCFCVDFSPITSLFLFISSQNKSTLSLHTAIGASLGTSFFDTANIITPPSCGFPTDPTGTGLHFDPSLISWFSGLEWVRTVATRGVITGCVIIFHATFEGTSVLGFWQGVTLLNIQYLASSQDLTITVRSCDVLSKVEFFICTLKRDVKCSCWASPWIYSWTESH